MSERYYARHVDAHFLDGERWLCRVDGEAANCLLTTSELRAARRLLGLRSLAEHRHLLGDLTGEPHASALIVRLLDLRIVRPLQSLPQEQWGARCGIRTVIIITADRPSVLERCLRSVASHASESGRELELVVVDGSADPANGRCNVSLLRRELSNHRRVRYVGSSEAAVLARHLSDKIGEDVTGWRALQAGSVGSNRNIATLIMAGSTFLSCDDDIVIAPWRPLEGTARLLLTGHGDARAWHFGTDGLESEPVSDLFAEHEALLGRGLASLLKDESAVDTSGACSHVLGGLAGGSDWRVRLSFSGLAGDNALYCPYTLLFHAGAARRTLQGDGRAVASALTERKGSRVAMRPLLTHDPGCMAYCMGLDNRTPLPPFCPDIRNEDGVFGHALAWIDRRSLSAHVPVGVIHSSGRPPLRASRPIKHATQTRMSELLIAAMSGAQPLSVSDGNDGCRSLSDCLGRLGRLSLDDFMGYCTERVLAERSSLLMRMARETSPAAPEWSAMQRDYCDAFADAGTAREFSCPVEARSSAGDADAAWRNTREYVRGIALMLEAWPALWSAAEQSDLALNLGRLNH